jgi:hypothetical protein
MTDPDAADRSLEACPVCGEHRLALLGFPEVSGSSYLPSSEAFGIRGEDPLTATPPAIGCLHCGAEWPTIDAFRAAQADASHDHHG